MIANPASGRDIRRLVAHATLIHNQAKVGILRRVLVGLGALGVTRVLAMPDSDRLIAQAHVGLESAPQTPALSLVEMPVTAASADSERAANAMRERGVGCIVALGGDGTARAIAKGAGEIPLVLLSTGTNNVLPSFIEGTIAGMAAAAIARGSVALHIAALRHKWFEIHMEDGNSDRALVDIALLRGRFAGARAVWNTEALRDILVTRADPANIGISAIAAMAHPITPSEPCGLAIALRPDAPHRVLAAIGPGLVSSLGIAEMRLLSVGETLDYRAREPLMIALDGERETALREGQRVHFTLRQDGPWIVDVPRVMRALTERPRDRACVPASGDAP